MTVSELKSRLSVFYHIIDTDRILVEAKDSAEGTVKFFNLYDTYKVSVAGRQLPVLVMSEDRQDIPDIVRHKYQITPMNGSSYWVCEKCGVAVGETDNFCKNCGLQLN